MLQACGGAPSAATTPDSAAVHAKPAAFVFGDAPPGEFVSKRYGLHLRLPDGRAWRLDDHRDENLVAKHVLAATELRAARYRPGAVSGAMATRAICWDEAIARSLFPGVGRSESVVENTERYDGTADVHALVSIGRNGASGSIRYVAATKDGCVGLGIESKRLAGDTDETLADRLALLRDKVIPGLSPATGPAAVPRTARPGAL